MKLFLPITLLMLAGSVSLTLAADTSAAESTTQPTWSAMNWTSRGAGGGGAFFAPSFNPRNPTEMWVTSDMNPVLHTTNLQQPDRTWTTLYWNEFTGGRDSHVRYTSDPNVLYALDGRKRAPIKSLDGGQHWKTLSGWAADPVFLLMPDPDDSKRVFVAGKDNLFLSKDGGDTFTSVYSSPNCYVGGVVFDKTDGTIYVGSSQGLLKSTNNGNFAVQTPALPHGDIFISLTGAKDDVAHDSAQTSNVMRLVCVSGSPDVAKPGTEIEALMRGATGVYSLDIGGKEWVARTDGIPSRDKVAIVAMANHNINTIFAAGASAGGTPSVYKIADASKSWTWKPVFQTTETGFSTNQNVFTGWEGNGGDRSYGFDGLALDFTIDPADANYAAVTGDGFVHFTSDGGTTWHEAYVNPEDENAPGKMTPKNKAYHNVGLNDTAVHWLAWADQNTLFAGYTDIDAARSTDGGKTWAIPDQTHLLNTQYKVELAPSGALYAASSSHHDIYQTWTRGDRGLDGSTGNLIISTDKGAHWSIVHKFNSPIVWEQLDPKDATGNTMYASIVNSKTGGIYKTTNLSAGVNSTWAPLSAPPRTEGHPSNIRLLDDGGIVVSYSSRFVTTGPTIGFTPSSGVFLSTDGGKTWADRSDPNMRYYTKDVTIDPTDSKQNTWYAAVHNGFHGAGEKMGGLYKTTDRGLTWTNVCPLPDGDAAESCTINPQTKEIYLTTDGQGMLYAPDTTVAKPVFIATNYPYSHPYRVFINPYDAKDIWVVSYGNGIFEGTPK